MKSKGFFICIEGLDGCGKTTQTRLLARRLGRKGYDVVVTAEPSRGKIGRFIKKHLLHGDNRSSSIVEALLFAADRFEHVEEEILPCIKNGKTVVSDRYVYSSLAYQGSAGLDLGWIRTINAHAIRPDLALFIDVEPAAVVKRLKWKKSVMENLDTQRRVREVYMTFIDNGELLRIDGNRPERLVSDDILQAVLGRMEERR